MNLLQEYEARKNMGEFRRGVSEREWCKRHFLQQRRIREVMLHVTVAFKLLLENAL